MLTPRQLVAGLGAAWVYVGKTRSARNLVTGETVSRRQLEKMQGGRLATEGFTSYEAKAKARRASGLTGYTQTRPGVYEISVNSARKRKEALRKLPPHANVRMLAYGQRDVGKYGEGKSMGWITMNFAPGQGTATWMSAEDMLSVWDSRATRAGKKVANPKKWIIRVSIPKR
jgi:hypothetical protein